jgi:quinol-cytochrome oxidoreductase complex cytochrome b subunit
LIFMFALILLLILPIFLGKNNLIRNSWFKPLYSYVVCIFIVNCFLLGWIGGQPVIEPYYSIGQFITLIYFFIYFFLGFISIYEQIIYKFYLKNV